jgi:hypothetical protein
MKNLQNLKGAKTLTKKEQRNVVGGKLITCRYQSDCPSPLVCVLTYPFFEFGVCLPE